MRTKSEPPDGESGGTNNALGGANQAAVIQPQTASHVNREECFTRVELDGIRFWVSDLGDVRGADVIIIEGRKWIGRTPLARIIYAAFNGPLRDDHQVHHANGDRLDNRVENLIAMTASEHARDEGRRIVTVYPAAAIAHAVMLGKAGASTHAIVSATGLSHRHARHVVKHRDRRRSLLALVEHGDLFSPMTNCELLGGTP